MTIIYNGEKSVKFPKTAIALGTFDGLHIAHTKIINKAVEYGKKHNIPYGVMLFDTIPANSFYGNQTFRIIKPSDRNALLSYLDFIYVQEFNKSFSGRSPEEFVLYLKKTLHPQYISIGYNYRFGKFASGDAELLKTLCEKEGIEVCITDKKEYSGQPVSSTRIRELIEGGNVKEAAVLLGRSFFLKGKVINGYRNGHKIGSPTANIELDETVVLPKCGVYAGFCTFDGERHKCVINVGDNPTFSANKITVESHLIGFDGELYGKEIKIEFIKYLREEICFKTVSELAKQIAMDIQKTERELIDYE